MAAAAVTPCALVSGLSSAPRLHLPSTQAPNQLVASFPSSSKARNWRALVVVSAAPDNNNIIGVPIEDSKETINVPIEQNGSHSSSYRLIVPLPLVTTVRQMKSQSLSVVDLWAPSEIMENEEEVRMQFNMPGLSEEEINVSVEDGSLVIRGEHKKDEKGTGGDGQGKTAGAKKDKLKERSFPSYDMRLLLPDYCNKGKMNKEFKNGVLLVTIRKSQGESATPVNIPVT